MSTVRSEICEIVEIINHDNADSLEIAKVKGWTCVVKKGVFKKGDRCLYVPIDSCLPLELEQKIFEGAKVKLTNGRIRTIKLRGALSQGLVINPKDVGLYDRRVGYDATDDLKITKYEPPSAPWEGFKGSGGNLPKQNSNFHKYTSIENIKNHPHVFQPEDEVVVTEKLHGTNYRSGYVLREKQHWLSFLGRWFRRFGTYEFVVGSHNRQVKESAKNIYAEIARKYKLSTKLRNGEVVYGEIVGPKIQKNYLYGCTEPTLVVFDIWSANRYLPFEEMVVRAMELDLFHVPGLWKGKFKDAPLTELVSGDSYFAPSQKIREGVVVRPVKDEYDTRVGRKILKFLSPDYLMRTDVTEYH